MTETLPTQTQPRPTAMQKAAAERNARLTAFMDAALNNQAAIERSLKHHGLTFDHFMAALEVGLRNTMKNDSTFFEVVSPQSFLEAVLKAVHFGLLPDGKEGAIVRYASEAAFLAMAEGFTKILWATGLVTEINHNVICEGDDIDFQEGDAGYVTHRRSLKRAADAPTIGAWCVIKLKTGGTLIEVVDQVDLDKIARVSRATKGPRVDWSREMHRKAPFRRIVKRMPKTSKLADLILYDDNAYDLARAAAPEIAPAIPRAALFSNTAHKPQGRPQEALAPPDPQRDAEVRFAAPGVSGEPMEAVNAETDTEAEAGAQGAQASRARNADEGRLPADDASGPSVEGSLGGPEAGRGDVRGTAEATDVPDGPRNQPPPPADLFDTGPAGEDDIEGWAIAFNQGLETKTDADALVKEWETLTTRRKALATKFPGMATALKNSVKAKLAELRS